MKFSTETYRYSTNNSRSSGPLRDQRGLLRGRDGATHADPDPRGVCPLRHRLLHSTGPGAAGGRGAGAGGRQR